MAKYGSKISSILALGGRKNSYIFTLLDKDENVKIGRVDNIQSFTLTYNSLTTLKTTITAMMHDDSQFDFLSDRLKITLVVDIRGYHFEFPLGVYLFNSPSCERLGNTKSLLGDTRNVTLYSKLKIYQDDKIMTDYEMATGTNIVNEIKRLLNTEKIRIDGSLKVLSEGKIYPIGTSKLEIINDLLDKLGYNSLSVDWEGYFYSEEYKQPAERNFDFEYTDEEDQQIEVNFTEDFDLTDVYNVFTGYCTINGICYTYTYINDNASSPTSTTNLGRNLCADPKEYTECDSEQELIKNVKNWAAQNSYKYHKATFNTFINPLHGYLECLLFKNAKVNMKGIETQFVIDSNRDNMKHTIREAVYI